MAKICPVCNNRPCAINPNGGHYQTCGKSCHNKLAKLNEPVCPVCKIKPCTKNLTGYFDTCSKFCATYLKDIRNCSICKTNTCYNDESICEQCAENKKSKESKTLICSICSRNSCDSASDRCKQCLNDLNNSKTDKIVFKKDDEIHSDIEMKTDSIKYNNDLIPLTFNSFNSKSKKKLKKLKILKMINVYIHLIQLYLLIVLFQNKKLKNSQK